MRARDLDTRSAHGPHAGEECKPGSLASIEVTPEDLQANQRGYLSGRPRSWLHKFSFGDDMSSNFLEGDHDNVDFCQSGPYQLIMSYGHLAAQGG